MANYKILSIKYSTREVIEGNPEASSILDSTTPSKVETDRSCTKTTYLVLSVSYDSELIGLSGVASDLSDEYKLVTATYDSNGYCTEVTKGVVLTESQILEKAKSLVEKDIDSKVEESIYRQYLKSLMSEYSLYDISYDSVSSDNTDDSGAFNEMTFEFENSTNMFINHVGNLGLVEGDTYEIKLIRGGSLVEHTETVVAEDLSKNSSLASIFEGINCVGLVFLNNLPWVCQGARAVLDTGGSLNHIEADSNSYLIYNYTYTFPSATSEYKLIVKKV